MHRIYTQYSTHIMLFTFYEQLMKLWSTLVMIYNLIRISNSVHFPSRVLRTLKSNIPKMSEMGEYHGQKPKVIFVLGGTEFYKLVRL
jgi:hypothetical protein